MHFVLASIGLEASVQKRGSNTKNVTLWGKRLKQHNNWVVCCTAALNKQTKLWVVTTGYHFSLETDLRASLNQDKLRDRQIPHSPADLILYYPQLAQCKVRAFGDKFAPIVDILADLFTQSTEQTISRKARAIYKRLCSNRHTLETE
jgi:hypothetical protein